MLRKKLQRMNPLEMSSVLKLMLSLINRLQMESDILKKLRKDVMLCVNHLQS